MAPIFKLKTTEGYTLKILGELLQNNIKVGCFDISETMVKFCMMDHHRKILIDMVLQYENFSTYKLTQNRLYFGINLNHFHKMIKSTKKKDSIELSIDSETPDQLCIKLIPRENNRITTSYIKIQEVQNVEIDVPSGFEKPIIITSSDYQKMCKDLNVIDQTIEITSNGNYVKFKANMSCVYSRDIIFGEYNEDDDNNENKFTYHFDIDQLSRISKISGLSNNIQIFIKNDLPILFRTNVGNLGKISLYLKSKEQQETEEN